MLITLKVDIKVDQQSIIILGMRKNGITCSYLMIDLREMEVVMGI